MPVALSLPLFLPVAPGQQWEDGESSGLCLERGLDRASVAVLSCRYPGCIGCQCSGCLQKGSWEAEEVDREAGSGLRGQSLDCFLPDRRSMTGVVWHMFDRTDYPQPVAIRILSPYALYEPARQDRREWTVRHCPYYKARLCSIRWGNRALSSGAHRSGRISPALSPSSHCPAILRATDSL